MRPGPRLFLRLPLALLLAVSGCTKKPAAEVPTPQTSPPAMIVVAVEQVRVSGARPAIAPDTGRVAELRQQARERMTAAALLVDSIHVTPATLRARVGEELPLFPGPVTWVARDKKGAAIPHFGPIFRIVDNTIASLRGGKITGLRAGSTYLLVSAGVFSDTLPPRVLHTTRIPLTIW